MTETLSQLWRWTPFMFEGFMVNLSVTSAAMLIGTCIGCLIATLRIAGPAWAVAGVNRLDTLLRNIPTLILVFYLSSLIPAQLNLPWLQDPVAFPPWLKAAIALASSPVTFTAWNFYSSIQSFEKQEYLHALMFIPNWVGSFMITLLSSSVASLVGVDEILNRCSTIIKATSNSMMMPIYLYASIYFLAACLLIEYLSRHLKLSLARHYETNH